MATTSDAHLRQRCRITGQGQLRRPRQGLAPVEPVGFGLLDGGSVGRLILVQIAAEIVVRRAGRKRAARQQRAEFIKEQREARGIHNQQVDVGVQPVRTVRQQRQLEVEGLALLDIETAVPQPLAKGHQVSVTCVIARIAQVMHRGAVPKRLRAIVLLPVCTEGNVQHRMACHQHRQRLIEIFSCQTVAVELLIEMTADAPERVPRRSANQIGVLYGRQRERRTVCHARASVG